MKLSLFQLACALTFSVVVHGQVLQHTFLEGQDQEVIFGEAIRLVLDTTGQLTATDLLFDTTLATLPPRAELMPDSNYYLWTSLALRNASAASLNKYLVTLLGVDTMWVYTVSGGKVTNVQITGEGVSVWTKNPTFLNNMVPVTLMPGDTKYFLLRFKIRSSSIDHALRDLLSLQNPEPINQAIVRRYIFQAFYFGFMVFFCLLSLYMYRLFYDRVFLYFAGLMLSFGFYFLIVNSILDVFLLEYYPYEGFLFLGFPITGIILCCSFFIINYLDLWQRYRKYIWGGIAYITVIVLFWWLGYRFLEPKRAVTIHNILILGWVVLVFVPILLTAWRGEPKGKALLRAVMILFFASGIFLLQISPGNPIANQEMNFFQFGTMIFAAVLFYDLFTRIDAIRREKDRFQELDQLKSRFFANISHEFRTPLTLIMSPLQQLKEKYAEPEERKLLNLMYRNAERLLSLINQVLDLSKLEAGKMKLEVQQVNFPAFLKGIVMSFESLAQQKGIRLHFASEIDELTLWIDPQKIEQIFNNLLANAFKFTEVSEEVAVLLTQGEEWLTILVKDTGRGIPADQLPQIFNRFFQAEEQNTEQVPGTGIGLTLVKELVLLHGGTVEVKSIENQRTIFTLKFPLTLQHPPQGVDVTTAPAPDLLAYTDDFPSKKLVPTARNTPHYTPLDRHTSTTPLVLIVEDHEEVRFYLQQYLSTQYRILEAVDGQDGIDKALEYQPDLIISDVMMPRKNGYELCRTLKNDARTSHIPLVLLTAKAAREEKLHGLDEGADDYLLKPFDTEELLLRTRNLIASRVQLREQRAEPTERAIIDPELNATDRAFLEKIYTVLDTQLSNEQFSVEVLADEVGMSRRHLNRKLSALTDLSANPFIRNYRLQKALMMLKQQKGNVSEVALATGFSSTAYFVKCFREKFGQTPGSIS